MSAQAASQVSGESNSSLHPCVIALKTGISGLGTLITEIPFGCGLLFGVSYAVVQPLVEMGLDDLLGQSTLAKITRTVLSVLAGVAASLLVATLCGYTFTLVDSALMIGTSILASLALTALLYGCGTCTFCIVRCIFSRPQTQQG